MEKDETIKSGAESEKMRLEHTVCYRVQGLSTVEERVLVDGDSGPFRAVLTTDPDAYLMHGDTAAALAGTEIPGGLNDGNVDSLHSWIAGRVALFRQERHMKGWACACLVIQTQDEVDVTLGEHRELDEFVVCFDAIHEEGMRKDVGAMVDRLLASILLAEDYVVGFDRIDHSSVLFREDGKPVYSFADTLGDVEMMVTRQLGETEVAKVAVLRRSLDERGSELDRVFRLLVDSLRQVDDRLRAFFSVWQAMEIFINKTFGQHEKRVFETLAGEGSSARQRYADRIRKVMNAGRYGLGDKFALIATELSPETADDDLEVFQKSKDMRDDVMHGKEFDDNSLPVEDVRRLTKTYLRLHLES
jgi:hypothetical protein